MERTNRAVTNRKGKVNARNARGINIGAYKNGSNPDIDYAIQKIGAVNSFLCQGTDEKFSFEEELELLEKVFE